MQTSLSSNTEISAASKMRLLRVIRSTNAESGGPIEGLLRSSEFLIHEGHEVEVVSLEDKEEVASRSFPFPLIALGRGVGRYGYNRRLAGWIRDNAHRFDAAVLHGLWNYSSVGAWRALRKLPIPYFIFPHGMMDPWFREHYPAKHVLKTVYWWLAEGRVLQDANRVLFTSDEEMVRARRVFPGRIYREQVIRYGAMDPIGDAEVDKNAFAASFPALVGKRFLLFAGRIHPKKGCELLLRAYACVVRESGVELDLAIAGPDQVGWMEELKRLAMALGVRERVHWLGMLNGDKKWGALRTAQAFILPSHQENFGIVVAEAMACSTPVLISDKVNIWREVSAGRGGFVQPDTEEGTTELIRRFCSLSPDERTNMGAAARRVFVESFDAKTASKDFMRVIGFPEKPKSKTVAAPGKVLHVIATTDAESGGPIEALLRISEVLLRDGYEVALVSLEDEETVATRKFPFRSIGLGRGMRRYQYNPRLTSWLEENACRFDAVVLHGLWNYSSLGSWRALRKGSTPYYIFAHGMMDPWFRAKYPMKHFAKQAFWTLAEGRVLHDAQAVLFTCDEERIRARGVFKGHSYTERVVLFGTADPEGDPEMQKLAFWSAFPGLKDRRFLLYLGRIHPKKGCDLLIQAFAELAPELPADLDLVIAGPDQVGWVPELRSLARKRGISARIHWPGMLKGDVKWGAYRNAEAMILPSHQENFGFVVVEAMACSTPVLVSDKVNIWREVEASQAGLVETDTLDGTRNLIRRFHTLSASEWVELSRNARSGFLKFFDIEVAARDFARSIGFKSETRLASSMLEQE
jgi:glycosyltransferase involved in cell wall biosynthesis